MSKMRAGPSLLGNFKVTCSQIRSLYSNHYFVDVEFSEKFFLDRNKYLRSIRLGWYRTYKYEKDIENKSTKTSNIFEFSKEINEM